MDKDTMPLHDFFSPIMQGSEIILGLNSNCYDKNGFVPKQRTMEKILEWKVR